LWGGMMSSSSSRWYVSLCSTIYELSCAYILEILSIIASCFVHYGVHLGFGRHTAIVVAESGMERLFQTAKFQMLGYRK
jgi:hypothetical protein